MSLGRFHHSPFFDSEQPFEDTSRWRLRHPLAPFEDRTSRMMQPRMDLYESTDKNLMTATFELPGLSKDNVQIDVEGGNLAVSGECTILSEQQEQGYAIKERRSGKFVRSVRLPEGTQPKDVKASMENGILTVTYPKSTPGQEAKRIAIA